MAGTIALLAAGGALLQSVVMGADSFKLGAGGGSLSIAGVTPGYEEEVSAVFAPDIGKSIASVDVAERRRQLRMLPSVRDARVARVWPNNLRIVIEERVPIALVSGADRRLVRMIDAEGVVSEHRGGNTRDLPLMTGIQDGMRPADLQARLALFQRVMGAFKQRGRARDVQEVNLADSHNAVVTAKHRGQVVGLQMGDRNLSHRLDVFLNYFDSWQSEFGQLESVDLRFERQVAVRPEGSG